MPFRLDGRSWRSIIEPSCHFRPSMKTSLRMSKYRPGLRLMCGDAPVPGRLSGGSGRHEISADDELLARGIPPVHELAEENPGGQRCLHEEPNITTSGSWWARMAGR